MKQYGYTTDSMKTTQQDIKQASDRLINNPKNKAVIARMSQLDLDHATPETIKQYLDDIAYLQKEQTAFAPYQKKLDHLRAFQQKAQSIVVNPKEYALYESYIASTKARFDDPLRNALATMPTYNPHSDGKAERHQQEMQDRLSQLSINGQKPNPLPTLNVWERVQRYQSYVSGYHNAQLPILTADYEGLHTHITKLYTHPHEQTYLLQIRQDADKKNTYQQTVDATHQTIKQLNPLGYQAINLAWGARE